MAATLPDARKYVIPGKVKYIYDGSGRVLRALEVGHQVAAFYETRSKAIHWMVVTISGMKWQVAFVSIICLQETIPPRGNCSSLNSKELISIYTVRC